MAKKKEKGPEEVDIEKELGIAPSFFNGPITKAHYLLYAKLHRLVGEGYEDPYKAGPEKMARYFDSFLEFIRTEYPETNGHKGNLKSLIPKITRVKLPDSTSITVSYGMEGQESDYEIVNSDGSIDKVTNRHIEIAQMFKSDIQEGIFRTVTMLLDAIPKEEREEMENKYLDKARSSENQN